MKFPIHKLGDLCRITSGGTPSRTKAQFFGGGVPWVTITDMLQGDVTKTKETLSREGIANSSAKVLPKGTVLISIFATIGRTAILQIDAATNQAIAGVIPNDLQQLDSRYLKYFLDSKHGFLNSEARGVAQPNINQGILKSLEIELPPLQEQLRIVDLLARAENIVSLSREAKQKAAQLVPVVFVDMFGDPESNPRELRIRKVSDFVTQFQGGKNIQSGSEDPNGLRILKVSAVTSGRYLESESKPAPDNYVPPTSHFVRAGDMLFSRANTVDLVGATALVEHTDGNTLLPDKLWRIIWSEDVDVVYMHTLFQDSSVRRMLGKLATGTSDSMRNISQAKLFNLELPVATLDEQRKFGLLARQAMAMMSTQELGLVKACQSFDSLMSNAFYS